MYFDERGELSLGLGLFVTDVDFRPFFQLSLYLSFLPLHSDGRVKRTER
jgi:hypothetical protein